MNATDDCQKIPLMSESRYQRERVRIESSCQQLWDILDEVSDPEIPVLSLWDMGVLQDIGLEGNRVQVTITPTYSGCPAMDQMRDDITEALNQKGFDQVKVKTRLAPAWTSEWMTEKGRTGLRAYGIAAPDDAPETGEDSETPETGVSCPRCSSADTRRVSEFGSTACKALFQCQSCDEPFDYFKKI
ncbi:phenylacetate-CoA oxygenase subunit PaaJ [Endozoicomonas sp. OPT23]|uniref:1,2-phenylacetyl-CoA epoxidase subunit PaaD n=1 Tax=Endozoicomonas sp. OPT23 TaxID=2072845 RepID=UPI00129A69FD|nr:1,2-phenylacetyl-CoA epoxidase subunit PaaD [Endozoicomonas sp. OPT23]MRI33616.1 phenylacetate-CoA oxygenase subunit PaaJ [Endozoicomonas sp. OPT23]